MHFARLRLSGFKSFVDPTELLIEPGLTGVVGPNGCGKSNLLEALRWVMGENRAKSLRGTGMEDVIFAGTDRRGARGLAEVTLVLDNITRDAPAGWNDEDLIEVTRRIERDSGSAYRINGRDVRQKDVQLLFADAATGAHSPALVSQGRIGTLINAKPQDRRAVLEEAAGITGLHSRRREAENRLRGAEGNLARLQDVIQAMATQAGSLKRQAKQAIRYREISGDIRQAEAGLFFIRWKVAADEVVLLERTLKEATARVGDAAGLVASASRHQADAAAAIPALREAAAQTAAARQRLAHEKETLETEERRRQERLDDLKAGLEQIAADRIREADAAEDARGALTRLGNEHDRLTKADAEQSVHEEEARQALETVAEAANAAEQSYDGAAEQAAKARARRSSLDSDRLAVNRRAEQIGLELAKAGETLSALVAGDAAQSAVARAQADVSAAEQGLDSLSRALEAAEAATEQARRTQESAAARHADLAGRLRSLQSEIGSLDGLLGRDTGGADDAVGKDVHAEPGYERAAGAAFGEDLDAGLTVDGDHFWQILDSLPAPEWPGTVVPLSGHVTVPKALSRRLAFCGLVKNGDGADIVAALPPGAQLVSKQGALWRWDGYVRQAGAPSAATVRMEQRNRLDGLKRDAETLSSQVEDSKKAMTMTEDGLSHARQAETAQRTARRDAESALSMARRLLAEAEQEAARRESRVTTLRDGIARLEADAAETGTRLSEIDGKIAALPPRDALEAALEEARGRVEAARRDLAAARAAYDGLRRESVTRQDRLKAITEEQRAWERRRSQSETQLAALDERRDQAEAGIKTLTQGPADMTARRDALLTALAEAEDRQKDSADKLARAEETVRQADRQLKEAETAHSGVREAQIRAEAAVETATARRKDLAARIGERFSCAPTQVLEAVGLPPTGTDDDSLPDVSVFESRLEKLKRERDRLGAVNLRAEEELSEIETQMEHLQSEREDLEAAIHRLRGAIGSLNREGRERLLAAFDAVNAHFGDLFRTLFGGGEAHLKLTESDDPLEAGLEIFASPPGKRLQVLSLLSGGEQALTALSLIFAVFMTNPAPICVLDEVDAPLDDANVESFCNLLDAMTTRTETRFLNVTHNAVTMSRMRRLFGVTMAERGVSSLVSVDLERAAQLREAS